MSAERAAGASRFPLTLVARGAVIDTQEVEFPIRGGAVALCGPDVARYLDHPILGSGPSFDDLYSISIEQIVSFLTRLGPLLDPARNACLREAYELSRHASGLPDPILRHQYELMSSYFSRDFLLDMVNRQLGVEWLEGWVETRGAHGGECIRTRAFGARTVHVIAGNVPSIGALTVARNALTRSDGIIKAPGNDPLTALAIARTLVDLDPSHPITRHLCVAYWKGGNSDIEKALYQPGRIHKIVAWGGYDSIRHIAQYIRPGLELITFDPKHSLSIIGPEAFEEESTLQAVAERLALDVGAFNQEACFSSRIAYVICGTDVRGRERADRLGRATFEALQRLPAHISTEAKEFNPELRLELDGLRLAGWNCRVFGGRRNEGAVVVTHESRAVDFAASLGGRVCNLVAVGSVEEALAAVNSSTQTVGVYSAALRESLRDRLALRGAQRLVPLGRAAEFVSPGAAQDGFEPMRRLCRWVVEEVESP